MLIRMAKNLYRGPAGFWFWILVTRFWILANAEYRRYKLKM